MGFSWESSQKNLDVGGYQSSGLKTAEEASGITRVNAGGGNIFGNHCTGSYDHMIADHNREDRCICSDTHMIAEFSWPPKLRLSRRATVAEQIVNEHRAVRNETVIPDRD